MLVGCDKAKVGYLECKQLEAAGKLTEAARRMRTSEPSRSRDHVRQARHQRGGRHSGEARRDRPADGDDRVVRAPPAAPSVPAISRAQAKLGGAGGDVGTIISDNVQNLEYDCREDVGKPTAGLWLCRWNETFDTSSRCDGLGSR